MFALPERVPWGHTLIGFKHDQKNFTALLLMIFCAVNWINGSFTADALRWQQSWVNSSQLHPSAAQWPYTVQPCIIRAVLILNDPWWSKYSSYSDWFCSFLFWLQTRYSKIRRSLQFKLIVSTGDKPHFSQEYCLSVSCNQFWINRPWICLSLLLNILYELFAFLAAIAITMS